MRILKNVISDTIRDKSRLVLASRQGGTYAATSFARLLAFIFLTTFHFLLPTSHLHAAVWYQSSYNDFNAGLFNYTTIKDTDTAASVELAYQGPQELSTTVVGSTVVALYRFNNPPQELSTTVAGSTVVALYRFNNPPAELSADANTVGLWRMNEASWNGTSGEVIDASGNGNHGTAKNGANTVAGGMFGRCGSFDGTNDYVSLPDSSVWDFGSGNFTVEFWFCAVDTSYRTMFAGNTDFWLGMFLRSGKMNYFASSNGTSWDMICGDAGPLNGIGSNTISPNVWYHATFTRNGNNWLGYINGRVDLNLTVAGTLADRNETRNIGRWGNNGYWLNGKIDEFRVSNINRSAATICQDAGGAVDSSGQGNHGSLNIATQTYTASMTGFGNALQFNGVSDYGDCGITNFPAGNVARTIEMWIKPDSVSIEWAGFLRYGSLSAGQGILFHTGSGGNANKLELGRYGSDVTGSQSLSAGVWQHIAASLYNGDKVKFYVNGVEDGPYTLSGINTQLSSSRIGMGGGAWTTPNYKGLMDEIRVTSGALSASQIATDAGGAYDSSSFGNHGGLNIATQTYTASMDGFGNALQFNGVSDYVDLGTDKFRTQPLTLEGWFNADTLKTAEPLSVYGGRIGIKLNTTGFSLQWYDGAWRTIQHTSSAGVWHHIVGIIPSPAATAYLYINGVEIGSSTCGTIGFLSGKDGIGAVATPDWLNHFQGLIDEVRITFGALTAAQIVADAVGSYYSTGTYKSSVFDAGTENIKVFYSSWSPTSQPAGTSISVAVRAANTSFAADAASPAWTPATNGGNPDVTGRYIQWMSTFTTTNSTTTPRLEEITLSYIGPPTAPELNYITGDTFNQITWRWQDNSSGTSQETGFKIYTSTGGFIGEVGQNVTYYAETALKRNKEYARYVKAYNVAGAADSSTATWRTKPGAFQSRTSQGNPTRTGTNAFGFVGDATWEWDVPVKAGSVLTITAYIRYNSDYGGGTKPKLTLSGKGISPTSVSATGAAEDAWELLTLNPGTPTENAILTLKAEGFSTNPGAKFYIDDINISQ